MIQFLACQSSGKKLSPSAKVAEIQNIYESVFILQLNSHQIVLTVRRRICRQEVTSENVFVRIR